jgi:long-chain acyl-CoA synthetase
VLVSDILDRNVRLRPNATAVVAGSQRTSFAELQDASFRLATALRRLASPGDRVAILARNHPAYVTALYAAPSAQMVLTLVNYRLNPQEWAWIISNAQAAVLIVEQPFLEEVRGVLADMPSVQHLVVLDGSSANAAVSYDELLDTSAATPPAVEAGEEDTACIIYTSGTTGFPKGAMISHRNATSAAVLSALEWDVRGDDRFLMSFPMCHASGFQIYVYHLRGVPVVLMGAFDPGDFLHLIEEHRITRTSLAPTMASMVLDHPAMSSCDVSSIRCLAYGGMPMPAATARALADRFGDLMTGFGQTESTLMVTHLSPADHRRALAGEEHLLASCGAPSSLTAVTVMDERMQECPPGEVGEMVVRSDLVMKGYWDNEEGTAAAFSGGWLHTGDLARRDEEGFLYIVDRKKDMLISGGQNIYPAEIERVLYEVPAIAEAAVIGVPDPVWGESVAAYVVLRAGAQASAEDIVAECRRRLAGYKKPKHVVFVSELPKNVTGKVRKRELRARFSAGS